MRTRPADSFPLFASRHQAELLAELFDRPESWRTFDDLRDACGVSASTLHDELMRLRAAGMIERDDSSRPYRFRPDMTSPYAEPVQRIVDLSRDVEQMIRRALSKVDGVDAAAIFGSWARGEAGPESDIDVIVVGDFDHDGVSAAIRPLELAIDRDINLVLIDGNARRALADGPFFREVLSTPPVALCGDLQTALRPASD